MIAPQNLLHLIYLMVFPVVKQRIQVARPVVTFVDKENLIFAETGHVEQVGVAQHPPNPGPWAL